MIVTKTYLSKCNTIVKDNNANLSLNPILELNYGKMLSRGLIYFDHIRLKNMVEDKIYPEIGKLRHVLKMTNCASLNNRYDINCPCLRSDYDGCKKRASSFDLILFLLPKSWDDGRGFDYVCDLYEGRKSSVSVHGCNWYFSKSYHKWDNEGVYSVDRMLNEYDVFSSNSNSKSEIIVARQHFEYGNENLEIDITETVNKFITGELENYGLGIAFAPLYETFVKVPPQYVGFFTQHTNSFYEPYVETTYDEFIEDDRTNFYLDKRNKLYFYAMVGGNAVNLDEMPTCELNGQQFEVKQATKGYYYIETELSSEEYEPDTMYYDVWDNIVYKGKKFPKVELSFVTQSKNNYYSFGLPSNMNETSNIEIVPSLYGINYKEQIKRGTVRKLNVECKVPYSTDKKYGVDGLYYRLYAKEGDKQIDVISWTPTERGYNENFFYINTNDLIPFRYYMDVKIIYGLETELMEGILEFDVVSDASGEKR